MTWHFVLAELGQPSGGDTYNRRHCRHLQVTPWAATTKTLPQVLAAIPDGDVVLIDGLLACPAPDVVAPHAARLRLAVLVHLPLADETGLTAQAAAELDARERETLTAAATVVATSGWAARRLIEHHGLEPERVQVVEPGVDPAAPGDRASGGGRLLCVAAVIPRKGQDLLVRALAEVAELPWSCELAGPLRDAEFVETVRRLVERNGLRARIRLMTSLLGDQLDAAYRAADLLVLPSRAETYGMVVTEALARGVPVLATAVGGVPEALGLAPDGSVPGMLVPPGEPAGLAAALRRWLTDAELRERLRAAAEQRRRELPRWEQSAERMTAVLQRLAGLPR